MAILNMIVFLLTFGANANIPTGAELGVPKINLNFWNTDSKVQWNNNCYNYSTNRVTNSFAQPGEASENIYDDLTCESVELAASKDLGLTLTKHFQSNSKNEETLIALVVAPGYDFHWYRRDDNNMWSHKPGATPATAKDQSDELISDPETADRGFYTDFCGYFKVANHLHDSTEQNSGYVRIGNMLDLPDLENTSIDDNLDQNSEIEILLYSGRKNPRVPLDAFIASGVLSSAQVQDLTHRINSASNGVMDHQMPSRLGYNGILIRDHHGLLFPKGTAVHVVGNTIIAYSKSRTVVFYDESVGTLEKLVRSYIDR